MIYGCKVTKTFPYRARFPLKIAIKREQKSSLILSSVSNFGEAK